MEVFNKRQFVGLALFLCGAYLAIAAIYIFRLPLVMDEFDGAFDVYRLHFHLPYRDFKPYKTVLGYYFQLAALFPSLGVWNSMLVLKIQLAAVNALCMFVMTLRLSRLFSRESGIFALLMLVTTSTWLERSCELRVDALTAWPGLFSLLCLLNGSFFSAGLLGGLSFLVSQKGIYYLLAGGACALLLRFSKDAAGGKDAAFVRFAAGALLPLGLYFGLWSLVGTEQKAAEATFYSHYQIVFENIYHNRSKYWRQEGLRNPLFWLGTLLSLSVLFFHALSALRRRKFTPLHVLWLYGAVILACGLWHRQPWPYFFVILIPTFIVVLAGGAQLYITGAASGIFKTAWRERFPLRLPAVVWIVLLVCSLIMQMRRFEDVTQRSSGYQRAMVNIAEALLGPNETYVAGVDFIYTRSHASSKLKRLGKRRRQELLTAPKEVHDQILLQLEAQPPKVVVGNYRLKTGIPRRIRDWLHMNYRHLWGSISVYAPVVPAGYSLMKIRYPGLYLVESGEPVMINDMVIDAGSTIRLEAGLHEVAALSKVQFCFQPDKAQLRLNRKYAKAQSLFAGAYTD